VKRTLTIGVVAAVIALGGGALVANAADHANFAGSSQQDGRGGFGGGPPGGQPPFGRDE
jgi:uncharacterized membrane protein